MAKSRYYGAKRDRPDGRDLKVEFVDIPTDSEVDLSKYVPRVYNQGHLESCTANAVCGAYCIDLKKQELPDFNPSRLFLYYNTREIEKTVDEDSGAYLRHAIKALKSQGVCPERCWPYVISEFKTKPSPWCYQEAKGNTVSKYKRIVAEKYDQNQLRDQLRACLKAGYPFVFSFKIFPSFHDTVDISGVIKMPTERELQGEPEGGHAVVAVGYNDKKKTVKVLNSWGQHSGFDGYIYLPYDYITDSRVYLDFWKIEFVQETEQPAPNKTQPSISGHHQVGQSKDNERPTGMKKGVKKQSSKFCTLL